MSNKEETKHMACWVLLVISWIAMLFLFNHVIESDARRVELLNAMEKCGCEVP